MTERSVLDVSTNNQSFSAIRSNGRIEGDASGSEIDPSVESREGEFVAVKRTVWARFTVPTWT